LLAKVKNQRFIGAVYEITCEVDKQTIAVFSKERMTSTHVFLDIPIENITFF
jgi:hypothetical protein